MERGKRFKASYEGRITRTIAGGEASQRARKRASRKGKVEGGAQDKVTRGVKELMKKLSRHVASGFEINK